MTKQQWIGVGVAVLVALVVLVLAEARQQDECLRTVSTEWREEAMDGEGMSSPDDFRSAADRLEQAARASERC